MHDIPQLSYASIIIPAVQSGVYTLVVPSFVTVGTDVGTGGPFPTSTVVTVSEQPPHDTFVGIVRVLL